jgi:hypothetical protein
MTIHQCPKCELRFEWTTELDDHCWHDHPEFRHEYPAQPTPEPLTEQPSPHPTESERVHRPASELFLGWMNPRRAPTSGRHVEEPPQRKPG